MFLCLPTSAEEMIDESLSLHWEPSGLIKSCHRFSGLNAALLNQISTDQVACPIINSESSHLWRPWEQCTATRPSSTSTSLKNWCTVSSLGKGSLSACPIGLQ